MVHNLIEILLPVADNEGQRFDTRKYQQVKAEFVAALRGHHYFTRAPAHGTSKTKGGIIPMTILSSSK